MTTDLGLPVLPRTPERRRTGVSCGNGKGRIFRKGQVITTVPEHKIVGTLLDEAPWLAETTRMTSGADTPDEHNDGEDTP
ncbi:hypothetical protein [Streptomyces lushanensis]|uniref:hypothetical protein n=1 Tax=Streptomyces lushanensis TaxID=1434255 RepID=UPI00082F76CE